LRDRKNLIMKKKLTLGEGKVCEGKTINPFCRVSSIDAISDALIIHLSIEQKIKPIGFFVLRVNPTLLNTLLSIGKKHYT